MNLQKHYGFTLAEVLITLGIIGIVAAITIPALNNKIQDEQYKTAYKKAYSTISQAFLQASQDSDIVELTGSWSSQGAEANFSALKQRLKVVKSCNNSQSEGCWNVDGEQWRTENYLARGFVDNNGMAWKLRANDSSQLMPAILLDTNGNKAPNVYGKDRFVLFFSKGSDSDAWSYLGSNSPIGMPTKISPMRDVPQNSTITTEENTFCPSYKEISCNFTSWLFN